MGDTMVDTQSASQAVEVVSHPELWTIIFELIRYLVPVGIIFIVIGVVSWKLIAYGIDIFVKKFTKVVGNADTYVTEAQLNARCKDCQRRREDAMDKHAESSQKVLDEFKKEVLCGFKRNEELFSDIRQIVLVTALKAGVTPEELAKLTNIPRTLYKNL
jgi:hypothetical protein